MASGWPNIQKSFQQKYRVFSAAFWQNNGSTFDLEKSDKIVLPPSALNALTDCNASFPVLLKIQIIDSFSNKPLPSNVFSYVIDYSAPEGLIYMSSWMINKLQLDQSGQSVVELSLPTDSNLKYQCPSAEFLQLQPHSLQLMLLNNITDLVHQSLSDYYSSLRIGDDITVYAGTKTYGLTVVKLSGKETSYTPKVVRLNNNVADTLMLGFSEPKNYELEDNQNANNDNNNNQQQDQSKNDDKKENENEQADEESDGEWEIVSVEKVKSLDDLKWSEPGKKMNENENDNVDDDVKVPSNDNQPAPQQPPEPEQKQPSQPQPEPIPIPRSDPIPIPKPQPQPVQEIIYTEWDCPKCGATNDMAYKFCPKCGCNKESWKPPQPKPDPVPVPIQDEAKQPSDNEMNNNEEEPPQPKPDPVPVPIQDEAKQPSDNEMNNNEEVASGAGGQVISDKNKEEINEILLKKVSIINDGVFQPSESRQTGW
eukprot:CAMPEP_0201591982 /NCGR_PEP_ID=MMETSP0190_2-20130828/189998_1 /ASSEMBLY_ACC=CAM_ASM_000263 /TAXON_ID=37353 /ORGANISM="Rosalina sp." /LENGTH=480 /DNA_ID=CAMNT_0048050543 /DNA_START=116 /DNA_END=1556 /DNA_ORIENTATION=-